MNNVQYELKSQSSRMKQLQRWIHSILGAEIILIPLQGDASFRSYYRITHQADSFIVMDAPPTRESCISYIAIAEQFHQLGIQTPTIFAKDIELGFLLLSDFGDQLLLNGIDLLDFQSADVLYTSCFDTLLKIQSCAQNMYDWPLFSKNQYLKEFELFKQWYLIGLKHMTLSLQQEQYLQEIFTILMTDALEQPQVCVHRDYHSRNLMLLSTRSTATRDTKTPLIGVLDFQDALFGSITYDLVSLLKDCYIDWPEEQVRIWALHYQRLLLTSGLLKVDNPQQFLQWFDWTGLQRHLKCLGIFSRLYLLYKKPGYLQYIPRVLRYIKTVCYQYPEFNGLAQLLEI